MKSRIFLIGFMGSGKTTLGKKLARQIAYSFVDMDALIEETAGMSVADIFREHGEATFRKWERDILLELCLRENVIISTGGGAPCHGDMMDIMMKYGSTIYLELSPRALRDRLIKSPTERPLIRGKSEDELLDFIDKLLKKREAFYTRAEYRVDGINLNVDTLVNVLKRD